MPELPEVETVKRVIEPQLTGRTVMSVRVLSPQVIAHPSADSFARLITGNTFSGMGRRGKFLLFSLENGLRMVLHLRMTGQLLITPEDDPLEKHTHLVFSFSGGMQLRYIDLRRFGRFWLFEKDEPDTLTGMDKLGREPTPGDIPAAYLKNRLGLTRKPIKEMLLDQGIIAGIGNIYSDEILFACGIHPRQPCNTLTDTQWQLLSEQIPLIIQRNIDDNAISPEEYLEGRGKEYRNTPFLKAYGHAGDPCPVCGTPFQKLRIGGRSSTFCPHCQILSPST